MMKRITAVTMVVLCLLMLVPNIALAMHSEPSHLTIIVNYEEAPIEGMGVAIYRVADAKRENAKTVFDITEEFAGIKAEHSDIETELAELSEDSKNIALAANFHDYAQQNDISRLNGVTNAKGEVTFSNLVAGYYLVVQTDMQGSSHEFDSYLVMAPTIHPSDSSKWKYEVHSLPKTQMVIEHELVSLSVYKVWKGTDKLPDSIEVQLYCNGSPLGTPVTLNAGNFWNHTWENLNEDETWTVDEVTVPDGYIKTISGDIATGFVITNTKDSTSSSYTPSEPQTPQNPDQPNNPGNPKTEDLGNMQLWILLLISASVGMLLVICAMNSKRFARIFKK